VLIWFVPFITKVVVSAIKSKGDDEEFKLEYIGTGLLNTAELSLEEAQKETALFGKTITKMVSSFKELLDETKPKKIKKLHKKMRKYEEVTDQLEEEISKYLSKVADGSLSSSTSTRVVSILSIINDLERIGDVFFQMSKDMEARRKQDATFSKKQRNNLDKMMGLVEKSIEIMNHNLSQSYQSVKIDQALEVEHEIDATRNKFRKELLELMEDKKYDIKMGALYKDLFQSFEKIGDHVINVTEAITGETERSLKKVETADV
ncbi:MAG: PhoU domain-containing protein, partial [Cyclobacteriaceae bacterium]